MKRLSKTFRFLNVFFIQPLIPAFRIAKLIFEKRYKIQPKGFYLIEIKNYNIYYDDRFLPVRRLKQRHRRG